MARRLTDPVPSGGGSGRLNIALGRRYAFTFVEMIAVMLIITILAAIAAPRFSNFYVQQRVQAAAQRIDADLTLAARRARLTGSGITVAFDVANDRYELQGLAHPDHPGQPYVVDLTDPPYEARISSASFNGDTTVIFDAYGEPDSGGSLVVAVGNAQRTITVSAGSSKIEQTVAE